MKKLLPIVFLLLAIVTAAKTHKKVRVHTVQSGCFIKNNGQWPNTVLFLMQSEGVNTWVTKSGLFFDYYRHVNERDKMPKSQQNPPIEGQVIGLLFDRQIKKDEVTTKERTSVFYNYFIGNNIRNWFTHVPAFKKVILHDIFNKIDMELSVKNGSPRYDFIIKKGGNPSQIKIQIQGAESAFIKDNSLILETKIGNKEHGDIVAFQQGKTIDCQAYIEDKHFFRFKIPHYNPNIPLRIDPLVYSSFLGGSSEDAGIDIAIGNKDTIYITGYSWSTDFPSSLGSYQSAFQGGTDIFVSGFSPDGKTLLFSTFLGGQLGEYPVKMIYNGNLILSGVTYSDDFPISPQAFQDTNKLGGDVFVAALNTTGNNLLFSTYVGGFGTDVATDMDVKGNNILVGGYTTSKDFPLTANAVKNQYSGDGFTNDGFLFIVSDDGKTLRYSSYFGGYYEDQINAVTYAPNNNYSFFVAGETMSGDFPVTHNAYDTLPDLTHADAFITQFDSLGIKYSTFLGGSGYEDCNALTTTNTGDIVVAGFTTSSDFPVTDNAFMNTHQGRYDCFISVIKPDGISGTNDLKYSSLFGGAWDETISGIIFTEPNKVIFSGTTNSFNFPTTSGAISTVQIGNDDAFVINFNIENGLVDYSTYFGGSFNDNCNSIGRNSKGEIILTGSTVSSNFPVTTDAYMQELNNSRYSDAFVSIIETEPTSIKQKHALLYQLEQNHPNPFHTITTIPYYLNEKSNVRLLINNGSGKVILTKEIAGLAAGKHEFRINGNYFAPGVYYYTIKTDKWVNTGKMIVQ